MKRDSKRYGWPMVGMMTLLGALTACSSADVVSESGADDDVDSTSSALWGGYVTEGCSQSEVLKIHDAVKVLLRTGSTGYSKYKACLVGAALVENKCIGGATIADHIRRDDVTHIKCTDLPKEAGGNAPIGISGERLKLDHDFIAEKDATFLAGVIVHELMHNRGFDHVNNPDGTRWFNFTVPQQAFGCLVNGKAFAWPAGGTPPNQDCSPTCPKERPYCCQVLQGTNTCTRCAIDRSFCQ